MWKEAHVQLVVVGRVEIQLFFEYLNWGLFGSLSCISWSEVGTLKVEHMLVA